MAAHKFHSCGNKRSSRLALWLGAGLLLAVHHVSTEKDSESLKALKRESYYNSYSYDGMPRSRQKDDNALIAQYQTILQRNFKAARDVYVKNAENDVFGGQAMFDFLLAFELAEFDFKKVMKFRNDNEKDSGASEASGYKPWVSQPLYELYTEMRLALIKLRKYAKSYGATSHENGAKFRLDKMKKDALAVFKAYKARERFNKQMELEQEEERIAFLETEEGMEQTALEDYCTSRGFEEERPEDDLWFRINQDNCAKFYRCDTNKNTVSAELKDENTKNWQVEECRVPKTFFDLDTQSCLYDVDVKNCDIVHEHFAEKSEMSMKMSKEMTKDMSKRSADKPEEMDTLNPWTESNFENKVASAVCEDRRAKYFPDQKSLQNEEVLADFHEYFRVESCDKAFRCSLPGYSLRYSVDVCVPGTHFDLESTRCEHDIYQRSGACDTFLPESSVNKADFNVVVNRLVHAASMME